MPKVDEKAGFRIVHLSYYRLEGTESAAARTRRVVNYFRRAGWDVQLVYAVRPKPYEWTKHSRPARFLHSLYLSWCHPFLAFFSLIREARRHRPDVFLVSAPPALAMQLAAAWLLRFSGIPVVLEEHDIMRMSLYRLPLFNPFFRRVEAFLFSRLHAFVSSTSIHERVMLERLPELRKLRREIVKNGIIKEDYLEVIKLPVNRSGPLRIIYTGSFGGQRMPAPFVDALEICKKASAGRLPIYVKMICSFSTDSEQAQFERDLARRGLDSYFELSAPLPSREEALAAVHHGDVALLITDFNRASDYALPCKLFDYVAMARPILAITSDSLVSEIVDRHQLGWRFAHAETQKLAARLDWMMQHVEEVRAMRMPGVTLDELNMENELAKFERLLRSVVSPVREITPELSPPLARHSRLP